MFSFQTLCNKCAKARDSKINQAVASESFDCSSSNKMLSSPDVRISLVPDTYARLTSFISIEYSECYYWLQLKMFKTRSSDIQNMFNDLVTLYTLVRRSSRTICYRQWCFMSVINTRFKIAAERSVSNRNAF
jgi:hypothetical protein